MKLLLLLVLCGLCAAAPSLEDVSYPKDLVTDADSRNLLVNALIRQFFAYIRYVINNGSVIFGLPPLDPLEIDHLHVYIPAGLINLDLDLNDIRATGFGGFVVNRSNLNLNALSFDIEITVPKLNIGAGGYELYGNLYGAIPLYGKGKAKFEVDGFVFRAVIFLKQSEDGKSVLIDRVDSPSFEIPHLKSQLTGVIGGGDIDNIVNAIVEDVIINYVNRFQKIIASNASKIVVELGNPILDKLDTWRFIAPLLPRPRSYTSAIS